MIHTVGNGAGLLILVHDFGMAAIEFFLFVTVLLLFIFSIIGHFFANCTREKFSVFSTSRPSAGILSRPGRVSLPSRAKPSNVMSVQDGLPVPPNRLHCRKPARQSSSDGSGVLARGPAAPAP